MGYLYRGVSKKLDLENNGELRPKGNQHEVAARHDGKIRYNGRFTYGVSENNAVRAHHIESGLYNTCYVSTTKNKKKAICFATTGLTEEGWVYVIDESLLKQNDIVAKEDTDPQYPIEKEVTLRSLDNGNLSFKIVIEKYEVDSSGKRKP
ncbi:MAG: hypothetical protein PHU49_00420 [Syntrophorhabdaceae bacterium]|nr:hypothetical protein [Syntrophorhabdaceae bacterium]